MLVSMVGIVGLSALAGGCGPVWYMDPTFAERVAAKDRKPLLLYFKSWDSTQHRNMRLEVFGDSAVKAELTDTVNVEIEFGWFPEHQRKYGVRQPQVCVMCTPDGAKVSDPLFVNPVPTKEKFLDWLKRSKAEAKPPPAG